MGHPLSSGSLASTSPRLSWLVLSRTLPGSTPSLLTCWVLITRFWMMPTKIPLLKMVSVFLALFWCCILPVLLHLIYIENSSFVKFNLISIEHSTFVKVYLIFIENSTFVKVYSRSIVFFTIVSYWKSYTVNDHELLQPFSLTGYKYICSIASFLLFV